MTAYEHVGYTVGHLLPTGQNLRLWGPSGSKTVSLQSHDLRDLSRFSTFFKLHLYRSNNEDVAAERRMLALVERVRGAAQLRMCGTVQLLPFHRKLLLGPDEGLLLERAGAVVEKKYTHLKEGDKKWKWVGLYLEEGDPVKAADNVVNQPFSLHAPNHDLEFAVCDGRPDWVKPKTGAAWTFTPAGMLTSLTSKLISQIVTADGRALCVSAQDSGGHRTARLMTSPGDDMLRDFRVRLYQLRLPSEALQGENTLMVTMQDEASGFYLEPHPENPKQLVLSRQTEISFDDLPERIHGELIERYLPRDDPRAFLLVSGDDGSMRLGHHMATGRRLATDADDQVTLTEDGAGLEMAPIDVSELLKDGGSDDDGNSSSSGESDGESKSGGKNEKKKKRNIAAPKPKAKEKSSTCQLL